MGRRIGEMEWMGGLFCFNCLSGDKRSGKMLRLLVGL
jgi:hypothetical protein